MDKIIIGWEGKFSEDHSLALVNKQIASRLQTDPRFELRMNPSEPREDVYAHVSHQWPPRMLKPNNTQFWIGIIPWEFGPVPVSWYIPMKYGMDEIWVYSQYNKDSYVRCGLPEEKIRIIPLGIDELVFHPGVQPTFFEDDNRFRFLYVGGTIARKGFDLLLEAYLAEFTKKDPVSLVVKDHGSESFYKGITMQRRIAQAQLDPLSPSIEYINGQLTAEQLASLYRSCGCSVFPYRGEGFGLPIAESMACGTPVIVPRMGSALEICGEDHAIYIKAVEQKQQERKVGDLETIDFPWWIEPDAEDLRRKMRLAFENKQQMVEAGKRASAHVRSRFTWSKTKEAVAEALENIHCLQPSEGGAEEIIRTETELATKDLADKHKELALGKFQALLNVFPDHMTVRMNAAHLYMQNEKYLPAIGLLIPLSRNLEGESDSLLSNIWASLAICYCGIQSWMLAIDAFRKAGQTNPEMNGQKIPYLKSAIHSLHVLMGYLHQEIGDAYMALNNDSMAKEMYGKALDYDRQLVSVQPRLDRLKEKGTVIQSKIAPVLDNFRNLAESMTGKFETMWVSAGDENTYPLEFVFQKKIWSAFYLAGQKVLVVSAGLTQHLEWLSRDETTEDNDWDGALLFLDKRQTGIEKTIDWYRLCTRHIKPGGKVILHTNELENEMYRVFCSLFDYGGWSVKAHHRFRRSGMEQKGEFSVFQYKGCGMIWQSPLYNASGYASEQRHFLKVLQPYPFLIQLRSLDASVNSEDGDFDGIYANRSVLKENPLIHYQAAPAHLFVIPEAPVSVGRTMFETDRLPKEWVNKLNDLTEVWVPSQFNKETFVNSGVIEKKIQIVPGTIDESQYDPAKVKPYALPDARQLKLLSVFDWSIRKGWDILIKAYMECFTSEDDVTLVLKLSKINEPAARVEDLISQMEKKCGLTRAPHILVMDTQMSEDEMMRLYAACDAFVLPTRGEGWGRPFMEAMAMEVPVIGTKWSGHLEFMNDTNSYLIDVERMVPVPESMPSHFHGHLWAEPSYDHLKNLLRSVVEHPERAREKGKEARRDLFPRFSMKEVGRLVYKRFDHLIQNFLE